MGRILLTGVFFFVSLSFLISHPAHAIEFETISGRIGNTDAIALAVPGGRIVASKNVDSLLVPASILKILTALVAFEHLGPDYRFPTDFYMDGNNNLIIKGYGDPFLISENLASISAHLAGKIDYVNNVITDGSYFEPVRIPGTRTVSVRSYDAPVGALCVNFNTVHFKRQNGVIISAESQTPLLPVAKNRILTAGANEGRVMLTSENTETIRYAGELFGYFLTAEGIEVKGGIYDTETYTEKIPDTKQLNLIYRYESEIDVSEIVYRMMKYSNNFIANQLMLASGAKAQGAPATLDKGVTTIDTYTAGLGITPKIAEGSGISRENRISAEMMIKILENFAPHHQLLQKRGPIYFKTGTLDGIQTRAGYIEGEDGVMYRFVVMLNTRDKLADPIADQLSIFISSAAHHL